MGPAEQLQVRRGRLKWCVKDGREADKSGIEFWMREVWGKRSEKSQDCSWEDNSNMSNSCGQGMRQKVSFR